MSKFRLSFLVLLFYSGFALTETPNKEQIDLNKLFHSLPIKLASRDDDDIKRELIKKARDTSETLEVRSSAIFALRAYLGIDLDVRQLLKNLARNDSHWAIRAVSFRSLSRAIWDPEIIDFLKKRVRTEYDLSVKIEIYRAFARARSNEEVYKFLLDQLRSSSDLRIKVAIVNGLFYAVSEDNEDAIRALKDLLRDPNPPLREATIKILSQDCRYFMAWICPENPGSSCRYNDPFQPPIYCP